MSRNSRGARLGLAAAAIAAALVVSPARAVPVNWNNTFALQTSGGISDPGVLVGFNPQPDPPGRIADINLISPPEPEFILHNQHLDSGPAPVFAFFLTMSLPAVQLTLVPDSVPTDNFGSFHLQVDGLTTAVGDINPISAKFFDVFLELASSSGGVADAASAVSFNPQPDPPGDFTPNDWGLLFSYTGNSDVSVTLRIFDAAGAPLAFAAVPGPATLPLLGLGLAGLGLIRRRRAVVRVGPR